VGGVAEQAAELLEGVVAEGHAFSLLRPPCHRGRPVARGALAPSRGRR
jgi:hypothetical protein